MPEATLRVLVVDDEPLARRGLVRLLAGTSGFEAAGECSNGREALRALTSEGFDLVLLDVEMPELDGFGVLAALEPEARPPVVFVTAYDEYAIRAFDAHALDYLLKPVDPERFERALERVRSERRSRDHTARLESLLAEVDGQIASPQRIAARAGGRTTLVPVEEIDWLEAADNYVRVHVGRQQYLHREPLAHLAQRLGTARFVRVHRSHVVRLDRVRELRPTGRGDAELRLVNGTRLAVSRRFRAALEERLEP